CDPSLCDENESCTLEEWDCTQEPCPAIATCGESCDRECEEGETCVLNYDVLCLSPPCPPISECVEDDDGEDDPCEEGEKCVLNYEVACIWPPCGPIPEC
ncbi:unnamed protein product, partial [Hapterophycus canaliculatus]